MDKHSDAAFMLGSNQKVKRLYEGEQEVRERWWHANGGEEGKGRRAASGISFREDRGYK